MDRLSKGGLEKNFAASHHNNPTVASINAALAFYSSAFVCVVVMIAGSLAFPIDRRPVGVPAMDAHPVVRRTGHSSLAGFHHRDATGAGTRRKLTIRIQHRLTRDH